MRKPAILLLLMITLCGPLPANPIMLESLIWEVYFENDEWYIAIDNEALWAWGIDDFDSIYITCNAGPLVFKDDFIPDFTQAFTLLTNDNLLYPVQIERAGDSLVSYMEGDPWDPWNPGFVFTTLVWNDTLPSPVCGPNDGQALHIVLVYKSDEYEWWLAKTNSPEITGGSGEVYGTLNGYVFDLNSNPVPNAEIHYIDDSYIDYPYNQFVPMVTDNTGYFLVEHLPARNYYISAIKKNYVLFPVNEYLSIEPGMNYVEYSIDYMVGQDELFRNKQITVINYPNPFRAQTEFVIQRNSKQPLRDACLRISDMNGQIRSILPLKGVPDSNGQIRIKWSSTAGINPGNYLYTLITDNTVAAQGKMTISP